MKTVFVLILLFSSMTIADASKHQGLLHGQVNLKISIHGLSGEVILAGPSEAFLGFDHFARTKEENSSAENLYGMLEKEFHKMISFSPENKCELVKRVISQSYLGTDKVHADVSANFDLTCERALAGSAIEINIQKYLPKVKEIFATVTIDNFQQVTVIKGKSEKIKIK